MSSALQPRRNILPLMSLQLVALVLKKYMRFVGPGLMVSVAYMDPGNYSTAVAAGLAYKYKLLFLILLSNCLAIFLQILSAKLGAVTGLDLAANCRANLPFKWNIIIYILAEIAIIATDLAEVVGTAIALNILFNLPLLVGVVATVVDVLIVLMAYRPKGPLLFIRIFESFVSVLVAATVVCFAIELYQVAGDSSLNFSVVEVMKGFLPNDKVVDLSDREGGNGLFLSLAILGATVMPHSLYLGSGLVQARLKDFDIKNGLYKPPVPQSEPQHSDELAHDTTVSPDEITEALRKRNPVNEDDEDNYRPSIQAINDTMSYTIVELVISLFTVALFVNAAILIVAGATLGGKSKRDDDDHHSDDDSDSDNDYENADLFTIYHLLSTHLSPTAGFVFALALLCSGQSAGVVCTLAGQMVLEGFLLWSLPPVTRRLITRGLAILPCFLVVSIAGRDGLSKVLNSSQVVLSVLLPFVTAPLIYFTCSKEIMKVPIFVRDGDEDGDTIFDGEGFDDSFYDIQDTTSNGTLGFSNNSKPHKFRSTEPAIRLQDIRNAHPCVGWEEDEEGLDEEQQQLIRAQNSDNEALRGESSLTNDQLQYTRQHLRVKLPASAENTFVEYEDDIYRIKGYKDMSNGPLTSFIAVVVWGFVTCLNLFLIGSMLLGYDVPL